MGPRGEERGFPFFLVIHTRVVKEQQIIGHRPIHEPPHPAKNILPRGMELVVALVVRQHDHILAAVPIPLRQEGHDVLHVVDAPPQLAVLPEVVDADQQRLAPPAAVRVLERVALRRAVAEGLHARGRRRRVARARGAMACWVLCAC